MCSSDLKNQKPKRRQIRTPDEERKPIRTHEICLSRLYMRKRDSDRAYIHIRKLYNTLSLQAVVFALKFRSMPTAHICITYLPTPIYRLSVGGRDAFNPLGYTYTYIYTHPLHVWCVYIYVYKVEATPVQTTARGRASSLLAKR